MKTYLALFKVALMEHIDMFPQSKFCPRAEKLLKQIGEEERRRVERLVNEAKRIIANALQDAKL